MDVNASCDKVPAVLPEVLDRNRPHWEIRVGREPLNAEEDAWPLEIHSATTFVCGVCGSEDVALVRRGGVASVARGVEWYEFYCRACGSFTEYEREWG